MWSIIGIKSKFNQLKPQIMLRPIQYSKPFKQRLFLDTPSNKATALCSSINVTPLACSSFHKQNDTHVKTGITEIKPLRQTSATHPKTHTVSAPKSNSRFSEGVNRYKSALRTKTQNFQITEKNQPVYKIINSFLKNLSENKFIQEMQEQMIKMRAETLRSICFYIINCLAPKNKGNFNNLASISRQKKIQQFISNNRSLEVNLINNSKLKLVQARVFLTLKPKQAFTNSDCQKKQIIELKEQVDYLLQHKQQLQDQIKITIMQTDQLKRQYSETKVKVESITSESALLENRLKSGKDFLLKIEELTTSAHQFVLSSQNSLVKQSAQNYKNIESQMFKLTELVSHCTFGKKDFQKSVTLWDIQKRMQSQLKMFNKFLIQNTHSTYQEKCKELKDFLAKIHNQYTKIYEELVYVIQQKTKYIKSFADYVQLWEQSYLQKSEYLDNLRTSFAQHCLKIEEMRQTVGEGEHKQQNSSVCNQLMVQVQAIIHLFKMGNFFY